MLNTEIQIQILLLNKQKGTQKSCISQWFKKITLLFIKNNQKRKAYGAYQAKRRLPGSSGRELKHSRVEPSRRLHFCENKKRSWGCRQVLLSEKDQRAEKVGSEKQKKKKKKWNPVKSRLMNIRFLLRNKVFFFFPPLQLKEKVSDNSKRGKP